MVYTGEGANAPLSITVNTNLKVVSPCDLTIADIVRLDGFQDLNGAVGDGGVGSTGVEVVHSGGRYSSPGSTGCAPSTPYTIDLYVDRAHPWVYGIGHFTAGVESTFCPV